MDHVKNVAEVQQLRRRYGNNLQEPEAHVRDGESKVVADVLTARLLSVADKVRLLVAPHLDRCESRGQTQIHLWELPVEDDVCLLKTTAIIKGKEALSFRVIDSPSLRR